ncbi:MAG: right-handed parallel beta-helix repeat-containing protein [Paramuribaculum sp.]|nr:right-handed parallel beta-helix repeat-containing protein [Paramuribaculum sp.]
MTSFRSITTAILSIGIVLSASATKTITVRPPKGDATSTLAKALRKASDAGGPVVIKLEPGIYNFSTGKATPRHFRCSNTAAEYEHPDDIKHIGLFLHGLKDITIDGNSQATLLSHGEMTLWTIDSCTNVTIKGLTIDAADPTVTEMTVTSRTDTTFTAQVHPKSRYEIRNGKLYWLGEGWEFTGGIAQIHQPDKETTTRCAHPFEAATDIRETGPGILRFSFDKAPDCRPGDTYQIRHSLRNELPGFINRSVGVKLENIKYAYLGNFGLLSQFSTDLTFSNVDCSPIEGSGRTNAGFADFFHFSGCRGKLKIDHCNFSGSQDDGINVHGTHMKITGIDNNRLTLRYMHPQTFGFLGFTPGDTIAITDPMTLLHAYKATVSDARMTDPYTTEITISPLTPVGQPQTDAAALEGLVVENLSWCPEVEVTNCRFAYLPTRGILMTTHRPVRITDNEFIKCPLPAILIADDARSWFESGPVTDVLIARNRFIDCSTPAISISPEAIPSSEMVHSNIRIIDNTFISPSPVTISAFSVNGLTVKNNRFLTPDGNPQKSILETLNVSE